MKHKAMETDGEVKVQLHVFLTSTLHGDKRSAVRPTRFTPGEEALCPLDRRVDGLQSLSGLCGVVKNILPMPGIKPRPSHR
jgi:hypothetical protein